MKIKILLLILFVAFGSYSAHAQNGWRWPAHFEVFVDSITGITDYEATVHCSYSCLESFPSPISSVRVGPLIKYATHYYQGPGTRPTGLPTRSSINVTLPYITLYGVSPSNCNRKPFSIQMTGLSPGTGYHVVGEIHSKDEPRTYWSGITSFVTTHNGRRFTRADTMNWLVDTATNFFSLHTIEPSYGGGDSVYISSYYTTNGSTNNTINEFNNIFYGPQILYRSKSPNIHQEVSAGNYFDHHTKNVDYWELPPANSISSPAGVWVNVPNGEPFYYTTSMNFEFVRPVSAYGKIPTGLTYRLIGKTDSIHSVPDELYGWLRDTATTYFKMETNEINQVRDSTAHLLVWLNDDLIFPNALDSMNMIKSDSFYVFLDTNRYIGSTCQDSGYFSTHTLGVDYWKIPFSADSSTPSEVVISNFDFEKHHYFVAVAPFEFTANSPQRKRFRGKLDYWLVSSLDSARFLPPISNNLITPTSQALCETSDSVAPIPNQLVGGAPKGAYGQYNYVWQVSYGDGNWITAPSSENGGQNPMSQHYLPAPYWSSQVSTSYYRRIATSRGYSDTSNVAKISVIPPHTTEAIEVIPNALGGNRLNFSAFAKDKYGEFYYRWLLYNSSNSNGWVSISGDTLQDVQFEATSNHYLKLQAGYHEDCFQLESAVIAFTPPDGDRNVYPAVLLGTGLWSMMNSRTTTYTDGSSMDKVENSNDWITEVGNSALYTWYDFDSTSYASTMGALYNLKAIEIDTTQKKICPSGWHVATAQDWKTLAYQVSDGYLDSAAEYMKAPVNWNSPNSIKSNINNFMALPAGKIGNNGSFSGIGNQGYWHSANYVIPTLWNFEQSYFFEMTNYSNYLYDVKFSNTQLSPQIFKEGRSIRCVQNLSPIN